jgi:Protein of unknown function (DUF3175)
MPTFCVNRAGNHRPAAGERVLERANAELRKASGRSWRDDATIAADLAARAIIGFKRG